MNKYDTEINIINTEELPEILTEQFNKLKVLEDNVKVANEKALEAKEKAESAQVKIGLFDHSKKEAINLLQSASQGLADSQIIAVEAQKVSFEYQTKLAEISKFLLNLGISNITTNRTVVRELELKLKGASQDEISDLAKQELLNVIKQLKEQEDIMNKIQSLTGKIKNNYGEIKEIKIFLENVKKIDGEISNKLTYMNNRIDKLEKEIIKVNKSWWKRSISIIAVTALIFNILHIINVL